MGVLVEAISVLVPTKVLEREYPGGSTAYCAACPNSTFCTDGKLTRVGFMHPNDANNYTSTLSDFGLILVEDECWVHMVVVDQSLGPTAACPWIEWGKHALGFTVAWLAGSSPSPMAAPRGWKLGQSAELTRVQLTELEEYFVPMQKLGNLEVALNLKTGREVFMGRTGNR